MNGTVEEFAAMRPPKALTFEDSLVILGKLLSDPGCEIMLGQKITMRDSISMKPFTHPCRAFGCKHVQCFDFEVYLHVNKSKLTSEYCCPICQQISNPSKIYVDSVFLCLLQIIPEDSTVNLMKDGTFEVTLPNKAVEIIDVDGDDEEAEFEESLAQLSGLVVGSVAELMYIVPFTTARSKKNHITLKELAEASLDDVLYLINVDNAWGINTIPDISDLLQKYIKKKRPYACTTIDGLLYCLRQVDGMGEVRAGRIVKHLFGVLQKKLTGFLVHIKSRAIVSTNGVGLSSPIVMEFLKKKGKLRSVPAPSSSVAGPSALISTQQQNRQNGQEQSDLHDRSNSDREGTADSHSSGSSERNNIANIAFKARANSIISVDSSVCEDSHHSLNTPSSTTTYTTTDSFDSSLASGSVQKDKCSSRSHHSAAASSHGNDTTANRSSSQVPNGLPSAAAHRAKGSSGICGEGIADVAGLPKLTRLGRNNNSSGTILLENCVAPEAAANNRAYTLHQVTVTDLCESSGSDVEASARSRELVMLAASPKQRSPRSRVTSPTASVRSASSTGAVSGESLAEANSPFTRRSKRSRTPEEPISPAGESVHSLRSRDIVDVDEAQDAISVSSAFAIVPVTSPSRSKRARREAQRQENLRDDANGSVVSEMTRSGSSAASSMVGPSISNSAVAENRVDSEAQLVQSRASTVTPVVTNDRNGASPPPPPIIPVISTPPAQRRISSQNVVAPPSGTHIRFQSSPESDINIATAASSANNSATSTNNHRNNNAPADVKPFVQLNRAANGVNKQTQNNSISATALSAPAGDLRQQHQARSPPARRPQAQVLVIPSRSLSTTAAPNNTARVSSTSPATATHQAPELVPPSPPVQLVSQAPPVDTRLASKSRDYSPLDAQHQQAPVRTVNRDVLPAYRFGLVDKRDRDTAPSMRSATSHAETESRPASEGNEYYNRSAAVSNEPRENAPQAPSPAKEAKWTPNQAAHTTAASFAAGWNVPRSPWNQQGQHREDWNRQVQTTSQGQWVTTRSPERRGRSRSRERAPGSRFSDAENDRARKAHNSYYNNSDRSDRGSRDSRDGSRGRTRENSRDRGGYGHFHQERDGHSRDRERGYPQDHDQDGGNKRNAFPLRTNDGPDRGHYIEKEHAVGWRSGTASARDSWNYQPPPQDGRGQDRANEGARDRGWRTENQTLEHPSTSLQAPVAPLPVPPAASTVASTVASVRPPPPVQIGSRGYNQAPTVVPNFPGLNLSRSVGLVRQSVHPPPAPSTLARAGVVSSAAVAVPRAPTVVVSAPPAVPSVQPAPVAAKPPAPPALAPTSAPTEAQTVPSTGRTTPWRPPEPKLPPPKVKETSTAGSSSDTSSKHTTHSTNSNNPSSNAYNNISQSVTSAKTKGIVIMYEGKVVPEPPTSNSVAVAPSDTTVITTAVPSAPAFAPKKKAQNNAKLVDTQPTPVNSEHVSATSIAQHKSNNSFHNNNFVDRRHFPQNALSTASTGYRAAVGNTNSHSAGSFRDGYNNPINNPYKANLPNNSNKNHEEGETFSSLVVRNFSATQE